MNYNPLGNRHHSFINIVINTENVRLQYPFICILFTISPQTTNTVGAHETKLNKSYINIYEIDNQMSSFTKSKSVAILTVSIISTQYGHISVIKCYANVCLLCIGVKRHNKEQNRQCTNTASVSCAT